MGIRRPSAQDDPDTSTRWNLIVEDRSGRYWRICPEELTCDVVAANIDDFAALWNSDDFRLDWQMSASSTRHSQSSASPAPDGVIASSSLVLWGAHTGHLNLSTINLGELISVSGDIASQIAGLPDGAKVVLKVVE